jgi:hypothetical protein
MYYLLVSAGDLLEKQFYIKKPGFMYGLQAAGNFRKNAILRLFHISIKRSVL